MTVSVYLIREIAWHILCDNSRFHRWPPYSAHLEVIQEKNVPFLPVTRAKTSFCRWSPAQRTYLLIWRVVSKPRLRVLNWSGNSSFKGLVCSTKMEILLLFVHCTATISVWDGDLAKHANIPFMTANKNLEEIYKRWGVLCETGQGKHQTSVKLLICKFKAG